MRAAVWWWAAGFSVAYSGEKGKFRSEAERPHFILPTAQAVRTRNHCLPSQVAFVKSLSHPESLRSLFVVNRNVVEALARKEGDGAERRQRRSRIAPRCNTCTGGKNLPPVGRPRARFAPLSNAESHHLFRIYIHHRGLEGQTDLRQGTRPTPSLDGMDKGRA